MNLGKNEMEERVKFSKVLRLGTLALLLACQVPLVRGDTGKQKGAQLLTERNSKLAYLLSRIVLKQKAGNTNDTGSFLVKLFEVPRGEECDVEGSACEGLDLLVSVASLDLQGDKALYQVKGLAKWEFLEWSKYAEYDSPEYFTSFKVSVETRDGKPLAECGNAPPGKSKAIIFDVNPWKVKCRYSD